MTTPEQKYSPSATLAQQALAIYDRKGEFAVLPFMMANITSADDAHANWTENGYCLMDDGSDVVHQAGAYVFGWHSPDTGHQVSAQRFSAMPDHGRPTPISAFARPVLRWPNRDNVWSAAMDIVESKYANTVQDDLIADPADSYRLAPSMYHAISTAIDEANTNDYVAKYADGISSDIAERAIAMVQPQELQALIHHLAETDAKAF